MADHTLPTTSSLYTDVINKLNDRFQDLYKGLDPNTVTSAATGLPTNSVRWNSTNFFWEKYNGSTWAAMSSRYAINIDGTVGATSPNTGAFTTLSSSSTTSLAAGTTIDGVPAVTTTGSQTLENKTLTTPIISSISNTGTLTLPTTTTTLVGTNTTDTLSNKTLTAPRFADLGFIADSSGNEMLEFDSVASATNHIIISNAAAGGYPIIMPKSSGDTNISLNLRAVGTGKVTIGSSPVEVADISTSQTFTNKLLSTGSTWNGNTVAVAYGGTGATTAATARANLDVPTRTGTDASGTWGISITGNAATVTSGVYTSGDQTIGGVKTFSSRVIGSVTGRSSTFGGSFATAPNSTIATQTSYLEIQASAGGATNSSGVIFHNPNISTAVLEYVNTTIDNGYFNFRSDDTTWNLRVNGTEVVTNSGSWGINVTGTSSNITSYTINQNLGTSSSPTFSTLYASVGVRYGDDVELSDINIANTVGIRGVQNAANGYIVFGNGDSTALGRAGTGALTYGGNNVLHAGNYNSYAPTLTGTGASGNWAINITGNAGGNAATATSATRITFADGPRDLSDRLPSSFTRTVVFDFVGAGTGNGTGNYAGVMTFSPWSGTTASTGDSSYQLAFANASGVNASGQPKLSIRNGIDSTWGSWYVLLHSGNYNSYAPTLTGTGASGNWAINITGNAGTVTNGVYTTSSVLIDRGSLGGVADWNTFVTTGIYQIGTATWSTATNHPSSAYTYGQLIVTTNNNIVTQQYYTHTSPTQHWVRSKYNASDWQPWSLVINSGNYNSYAPTLTGTGASGTWGIAVTGNAGTATTLQTARTINGTSFNGGGNITTANWGTGRTITIGGTGKTVDGSGNVSWTLAELGAAATNQTMYIGTTAVAINRGSATLSLTGVSIDGNAGSVAWSGVSSKPTSIMFYEGFTLDANTMSSNSTGFTYSVNAPYTGPIARFSAGGGYDLWLNAGYSGGGDTLAFRTRNGDSSTFNGWNAILHDGNYSSYALPNAYPSDWSGKGVLGSVIGMLAWKNYGNNHVIFDASNGTAPNGAGISNTNPQTGWSPSYPTLMGWNGSETYGVRVDTAKYAESAATATTSSQVTINYSNDSNSTYQMLWGSSNSVYGTGGIYCNPSTDYLYAGSFYCGGWFRSSGTSGWYNESYSGGVYMEDTTWVRIYNGKALYVPNQIAATGDITAYYSDMRLKTKIGTINDALNKVKSLEGFYYTNNELAKSVGYTSDKVQVALSAQDVEAVQPEVVSLAPFDMEADGNGGYRSKSGENYKTVDYAKLVPLLVEAIKELSSEVDKLKGLLNDYTNK